MLFFLYYKKINNDKYKFKSIILTARSLILLLLIIIFINPTFLFIFNYKIKPKLNIFVDNSLSMEKQIKDIDIINLKNQLNELNNISIDFFTFSNDVTIVDSLNLIEFNGSNTNFSNLFDYIYSLNDKSDILIISDGLNNLPFNNKDLKFNNRIFTSGVGDLDIFTDDLEITLLKESYTKKNDSLSISIKYTLSSDNKISNHEVFLSNESYENYIIDRIDIPKGKSFLEKNIIIPTSILYKNNLISIRELNAETNVANNSFLLTLEDNYKKYNCLLLSGALSKNTKKIKNSILNEFVDFELEHIFRISNDMWNKQIDNFYKYDIVVLDNYPLNIDDFNQVKSLLSKYKNKLIYFLGPNSNQIIVNQFISETNCVHNIYDEQLIIPENIISFNNNNYLIPEYYSNYSTECNEENTLLYETNYLNTQYLFIFAPNLDNLDKKSNILINKGIIEYVISNIEEFIYGREYKASIFVNKDNVYENDNFDIFVNLKDSLSDSKLNLIVQNNSENYKDIYTDAFKISDKFYKFTINLNSNIYKLNVELNVNDDYKIKSNEIILNVNDYNQELENIYLNENFLESISNNNNGIYGHISQISSLFSNFKSDDEIMVKKIRKNFLSYKYFLLILVLLFSIEWYYRNKSGLL